MLRKFIISVGLIAVVLVVAVGVSRWLIVNRPQPQREARGARAAFKGYKGFPAHICSSINEEVVHGIPSRRKLKEGDIVSVDIGVNYKGYYSDCARTWPVGAISEEADKLIRVTRDALLRAGIEHIKAGVRLGTVSHAIQEFVEKP